MLDFRIYTFLSVCRNMNYTKAAREMNLTQPAVSGQIRYLEEYYGVKLFSYANKKLALTSEGRKLKEEMEVWVHDTERIRERIASPETRLFIRFGATKSIGDYVLPDNLSAFMHNHPEYNISVTVDDTRVLLQKLDQGELDFIFCEGYFDKERYSFRLTRKEPLLAVCAKDYVLPSKIIGIESLFGEQLILREEGSGTRAIFERELEKHGYSISAFKRRSFFNSNALIAKLVQDKHGIAFLYQSVVKKEIDNGNIKSLRIPDFTLAHEFNAIWKKNSRLSGEYVRCIDELIL